MLGRAQQVPGSHWHYFSQLFPERSAATVLGMEESRWKSSSAGGIASCCTAGWAFSGLSLAGKGQCCGDSLAPCEGVLVLCLVQGGLFGGGVGVSLGVNVLMASLWSRPIFLWAFEFRSGNKEGHFMLGCQLWNGWTHVWFLWREWCRWSVWKRVCGAMLAQLSWKRLYERADVGPPASMSAQSHGEWHTFPWGGWSEDGAQVPLLCDSWLSPVTGAVTTRQVLLFGKPANC